MSLPVRLSDRGPILPVGYRRIFFRQLPKASRIVTVVLSVIVAQAGIVLEENEGILVFASLHGFNTDALLSADLLSDLIVFYTPAVGVPTTTLVGQDESRNVLPTAAFGQTAAQAYSAPFIPPGPGTAIVQIAAAASAGAGFEVGTRPSGGCQLTVAVVDLDNDGFTTTEGSP